MDKFFNDVSLEPRLVEYINNKKKFKLNNITPTVPLEKTYSITKQDLKTIYNYKNNIKTTINNEESINKPYFPSSFFKKDKRVPQIKNNYNSDIRNMGMFMPNKGEVFYEHVQNKTLRDFRDVAHEDIDTTQQYGSFTLDNSEYENANFDKNAINKPIDFPLRQNKNYKHKYTEPNLPSIPPTQYQSGMRDVDIENDIQRGMPSNTSKSYGYGNPFEHYYGYIDERYTNTKIFPRMGESTRDRNKKYGDNYKRDIF